METTSTPNPTPTKKTCCACSVEKDLDAFHVYRRAKDGRQAMCKSCRSSETKARYKKNPEYFKYRANSRGNYDFIDAAELLLSTLKANPCVDCGQVKSRKSMCFHHVRRDKSFDVGQYRMHATSIEQLAAEIAKCVLVCRACHRKRHAITVRAAELALTEAA
jgi:hypothetical protein